LAIKRENKQAAEMSLSANGEEVIEMKATVEADQRSRSDENTFEKGDKEEEEWISSTAAATAATAAAAAAAAAAQKEQWKSIGNDFDAGEAFMVLKANRISGLLMAIEKKKDIYVNLIKWAASRYELMEDAVKQATKDGDSKKVDDLREISKGLHKNLNELCTILTQRMQWITGLIDAAETVSPQLVAVYDDLAAAMVKTPLMQKDEDVVSLPSLLLFSCQ
jgi:hypothetical protein